MDLSQFLWLLSARALYFAQATEFEDKWEGKLPADFVNTLKTSGQLSKLVESYKVTTEFALNTLKFGYKVSQHLYGINCWHMNDVESVAMWELYPHGDDGVAIQTTVGRLKECVSKEIRDISIAQVLYSDHEAQPSGEPGTVSVFAPLITKRRSYKHESEVRVILERIYERTENEFYKFLASTSGGEAISVDLRTLVTKIVVAPRYPAWGINGLQNIVTVAGLHIKVETSDLLRQPESDVIPGNE
jgi:hypothetical protein